ncbi:MAG TPA: class 1 fructose-bisphosphatase [Methylomirabilota bacterium]|nr:class 1 fructose-bisphosphatase [Methylomirabilota bacterium]
MTLAEHLAKEQGPTPEYTSSVVKVILAIAHMSLDIARELAFATLRGETGTTGGKNFSGDDQKPLDLWAHEAMARALRRSHSCSAYISEEAPEPIEMPEGTGPRAVVVACDPVDGSSNLDVGGSVGTIFSVRAAGGRVPAASSALGSVGNQLAAGYVLYGPATLLVYTMGSGTHGFTLDRDDGEYLLTHPGMQVPRKGKTYGINEGNGHTWHPGQRAFVEHLRTPDKASGRPYALRYSGAMVADVHRTLIVGGIFMYPADMTDPAKPKPKLRLLYEVAPMAFVAEQAGGRASTGTGRVLDLEAKEYHQRAAILIGSADDVTLAESYYRT